MIKFIVNILTFYILNKILRRKFRKKLRTLIYGYKVYTKAKSIGKDLTENGYSFVTSRTILGNHVNFNGLKIYGEGNVKIGNHFHSGVECLIIAQNHDYDNGSAIPFGHSPFDFENKKCFKKC